MLQAALAGGTAHRRSVFELFGRRLPEGRRYGVVAGVGRALDAIEAFRFDDEVLAVLGGRRRRADAGTTWRRTGSRGDIWGYAEGETYFAHSPLLVVEATLRRGGAARDGAALDLQPRLRDRLGRVADDAGRRRPALHRDGLAADPRGGRGRRRRGRRTSPGSPPRPTSPPGSATACRPPGTSAHSFTLLHDTESDAFRAQVDSLGRGTTLLVDTYDVAEAVRLAVEVAGPELGAVRLDSGDLGALAAEVRAQLDSLGATDTRIIVTSDLDEFAIAALATAPVDGYGVGTQLVTGSGHPTSGFVYKLVSREDDERLDGVGRQEEHRQDLDRRAQVRAAASYPRAASPRPRSSASAPRRRDDGDDRPLLVPLVQRRRGRRA